MVNRKYTELYDSTVLDPLGNFSRRESTRKLSKMSPATRVSYHLLRLMISNQAVATVLVLYLLGVHLLVVFVSYRFIRVQDCNHDHGVEFVREYVDKLK